MHARCKVNKEGEKVDVLEQEETEASVDERGRAQGSKRDSRHR